MDMPVEFVRQHLIDPELCARCNSCKESCRHGAITHDAMSYAIDPTRCVGSMDCISGCSTGAIDHWRIVARDAQYDLSQQLAWPALPSQQPLPGSVGLVVGQVNLDAAHGPLRAPNSAARPVTNLLGVAAPGSAEIVHNEPITAPADGAEVRHIVLDFGEQTLPVLEGQSLGIIPPGRDAAGRDHHVRLYSVASARDGATPSLPRTVALTVKRVLTDHGGAPVRGVCSNYVCDLPIGAQVRVTGPVGSTFLMPDERGKVVAFPEDDLRALIDATGSADWLMSGSDYPHTEGVPTPNMFFRDQKGQFSETEIRKIMFENGRSILGRVS